MVLLAGFAVAFKGVVVAAADNAAAGQIGGKDRDAGKAGKVRGEVFIAPAVAAYAVVKGADDDGDAAGVGGGVLLETKLS